MGSDSKSADLREAYYSAVIYVGVCILEKSTDEVGNNKCN